MFNCDETGLYFKLMPDKTLASSFEKSADGRKTQKERVLVALNCLIGKSKNPRCLKNISREQLPVTYVNQKTAWVNTSLFAEWFHTSFVSIIQKKLVDMGLEPRGVLLLDNCSAHPKKSELVSKDGKVVAKFLPPNVTALIQPIDQGILVSIKRRYKMKILEELVFQDDEGMHILDFLKQIDMLKVATLIAVSWDEVSSRSLQLSWRKILPETTVEPEPSIEDGQENDTSVRECAFILQELGFELHVTEIEEWLGTDNSDSGYAHLDDADIVERPVQEEPRNAMTTVIVLSRLFHIVLR